MKRIKLLNTDRQSIYAYTGHFAGLDFVDGISTDEPSELIEKRILAITAAEVFDDGVVDATTPEQPTTPEEPTEEVVETAFLFTRDQLEAIADERGIAGLRETAEPYGVKAKSVAALIDELLKLRA